MLIKLKGFSILFGIVLITSVGLAQDQKDSLPAFPGAEGFGAVATGGRGGRVIHVTNLNAKGPGSLQWACSQKGARIIVFDVSGVIVPTNTSKGKRWLSIKRGNVTIAGQTAPGSGITINGMISFYRPDYGDKKEPRKGKKDKVENVIVRCLRARPYLKSGGRGSNLRGVEFGSVARGILDHISLSWSSDDCMAGSGNPSTIQWSAIEESDIHLEGGDEPHNFAMLTGYGGPRPLTFHHNLLAHHHHRAPMIGVYPVDMRNNVHYNIGTGIRILFKRSYENKGQINLMGHYCRRGPGALLGYMRAYVPPCTAAFSTRFSNDAGSSKYFVDGNYLEPWGGYIESWKNSVRRRKTLMDKPFDFPSVKTHTAEEGYELVLAHAGCLPRDPVGERTIREVETQTGYAGMNVPDGGLLASVKSVPAPKDADRDGMPDEWEKAHKLDPNDPSDCSRIVPAGASPGDRHKGYSYIEYYINELADIRVAGALTEYRLRSEPPKPWDKPAKGLSAGSRPHKTIEEMVQAVREQNESKGTRTSSAWYAIQQLSRMGEEAKPAVPELVEALGNTKDNRTASFAAWAIGAVGPHAKAAVPALVKALEHDWPVKNSKWQYDPRGFIAWALGRIGPAAKESVTHLAKLLHGKDRRAKRPAAWALSRMGSAAREALPELLKALGRRYTRVHAAEALANVGKPALPGLVTSLSSRSADVRRGACRALGLMGPVAKETVPELAKLLTNGDHAVGAEAARALGRIGADAGAAVGALAAALTETKQYGVRHRVAKALGEIGPSAAGAIPALEKALKDNKREVKRAAALALGKIGKPAVPALVKALAGEDAFVRKYAARALGKVGKDAGGAVSALVKALADKDAEVRREAVWSLALVGPAAKGATGALEKALKEDPDHVVRYAAGEAIRKVQE